MKTLLLMRHGKSSWKDKDLPDHERPLKKKGKKDSERMGELLKDKQLIPDFIFSSTAKRAVMTVEEVVDGCDFKGETRYLDTFFHAETSNYIEALVGLPDGINCVLIVGHNPSLEAFVQILSNDIQSLPTAALAMVSLPVESWKELKDGSYGKLVNLWTPHQLEK